MSIGQDPKRGCAPRGKCLWEYTGRLTFEIFGTNTGHNLSCIRRRSRKRKGDPRF